MSSGIFSIGTSALSAAYTALRTAGNNVANASTPGYSRQQVVLTAQVGAMIGGNYVGQGVTVSDIRRAYDAFLNHAATSATAAAAASDARATQLAQVDNLFADAETGLGSAIDGFFKQVQGLSQQPADASSRQALLSAANQLTARFADAGSRLQELRNNTDTQIRLQVDAVNRYATQISTLNDQIALARGSGHEPNDLLDQRDAAIRSLNESVRATTVEQSDGSVNVFLGSGQSLVVGGRTMKLATRIDPTDPQSMQIGVQDGATLSVIAPAQLGGGSIGGLLQFRLNDLPAVENELGRLAITLGDQFNIQHRLGNDRNGNPGGDFFNPIQPVAFPSTTNGNPATAIAASFTDTSQLQASDYRVDYAGGQYTLTRLADNASWTSATPTFSQDGLAITLSGTPPANGDTFMIQSVRGGSRSLSLAVTQGNQIAAASPVRVSMPAGNTGSLGVDALDVVGPTRNPALSNSTTLTFTGAATYDISDGVTTLTGQTYTAGQPITFNGWQLSVHGTPASGDQLNISANVGGIGDNRNALALAGLQSRGLVSGGQLGSAFAAVVARVGAETQNAQSYGKTQDSILQDALSAESSVSGVNLDEEASRLMQFQQQYQAAAKVIATASTIFEAVLGILQ
jgi:flagellar hook-associated protein 1 FlgK